MQIDRLLLSTFRRCGKISERTLETDPPRNKQQERTATHIHAMSYSATEPRNDVTTTRAEKSLKSVGPIAPVVIRHQRKRSLLKNKKIKKTILVHVHGYIAGGSLQGRTSEIHNLFPDVRFQPQKGNDWPKQALSSPTGTSHSPESISPLLSTATVEGLWLPANRNVEEELDYYVAYEHLYFSATRTKGVLQYLLTSRTHII